MADADDGDDAARDADADLDETDTALLAAEGQATGRMRPARLSLA